MLKSTAVLSIPEVKVNHCTCGIISVLCGIGDVRNRAAPLCGRNIGMMPEHYFENIYRSHNIRLECEAKVNPIVSYCILGVSYCTIRDIAVIVVADGGGWYIIMPRA